MGVMKAVHGVARKKVRPAVFIGMAPRWARTIRSTIAIFHGRMV